MLRTTTHQVIGAERDSASYKTQNSGINHKIRSKIRSVMPFSVYHIFFIWGNFYCQTYLRLRKTLDFFALFNIKL